MTATDDRARHAGSSSLRVRPARAGDAAGVAALIRTPGDLAQVSPDESFPLSAETVRHWIENRRCGYVLEQRGRVVGYAELVDDARSSDRVWIGHMMVAPARRGVGLGKTLVRALLEVAEGERGVREVAISAFADNTRALQCYRGCRFVDRGTHRVRDRDLVELRYVVPGRRPVFPLVPTLGLGGLAAVVSVVGLAPPDAAALVLALLTITGGLVAWALHPLLPLRRERMPRRIGRVSIYLGAVAGAVFAVASVLALATEVDLAHTAAMIGVAITVWALGLSAHARFVDPIRARR